jgi:chromosome segregation ATPase
MIYQIAFAVTAIILVLSLLWGGGVYDFEREAAREEVNEIREDLKEVSASRDRWKARANSMEDERETWRNGIAESLREAEAERDAWVRKADDFRKCFESTEKERDAYKKAKAENDERFMTERDTARAERDLLRVSYADALGKITDLDNLVNRIENVPALDDVKGSYRITAIRGPYNKTRDRLARKAARAGRRGASA